MKKMMIALLAVVMAALAAFPVLADTFVPSIKQKEVSIVEESGVVSAAGEQTGELIVRPITSEDKNVTNLEKLEAPAVQITSMNAALEELEQKETQNGDEEAVTGVGVTKESLELLKKIYDDLTASETVAKYFENIAKNAEEDDAIEGLEDYDCSQYAVSGLYGLTPNMLLDSMLEENEDSEITFTMEVPGLKLDSEIIAVVMTSENTGTVVKAEVVADKNDKEKALLRLTTREFGALMIMQKTEA